MYNSCEICTLIEHFILKIKQEIIVLSMNDGADEEITLI